MTTATEPQVFDGLASTGSVLVGRISGFGSTSKGKPYVVVKTKAPSEYDFPGHFHVYTQPNDRPGALNQEVTMQVRFVGTPSTWSKTDEKTGQITGGVANNITCHFVRVLG